MSDLLSLTVGTVNDLAASMRGTATVTTRRATASEGRACARIKEAWKT